MFFLKLFPIGLSEALPGCLLDVRCDVDASGGIVARHVIII